MCSALRPRWQSTATHPRLKQSCRRGCRFLGRADVSRAAAARLPVGEGGRALRRQRPRLGAIPLSPISGRATRGVERSKAIARTASGGRSRLRDGDRGAAGVATSGSWQSGGWVARAAAAVFAGCSFALVTKLAPRELVACSQVARCGGDGLAPDGDPVRLGWAATPARIRRCERYTVVVRAVR